MRTPYVALLITAIVALAGCQAEQGQSSNTVSGTVPTTPITATGFGAQIQAMTSVNVVTAVSPQALLTTSVSCAAGSLMVGGGCECLDDPGGAFAGRMKSFKPQGNGMACECVNTSGDPTRHPVKAHAICMTPSFSTANAP